VSGGGPGYGGGRASVPGVAAFGAPPPQAGPYAPPARPGGLGAPGGPGGSVPKRNRGVLIAAIAVVVLLVLGGGGYALSKLAGDDAKGGDSASQDGGGSSGSDSGSDSGSGQTQADLAHPDTDWSSSASQYEGQADKTISYDCPANGTIGTVWGSEPYTTDSSVCTAAVHAGRISLEDGGRVVIQIREGDQSYEGSTQYGIVTTSYGPYPWAFTFAG